MTTLTSLLIGLALAITTPGAPPAQRAVPNPPDPWVHKQTGTAFPAVAGGFNRQQVTEFSEDGSDAGIGYRMESGDNFVVVTLFVYPLDGEYSCSSLFDGVVSHIEKYNGAKLVLRDTQLPPSGKGAMVAHHARYSVPAGSMRPGAPALDTEAYLHCPAGGKWLVKARASSKPGYELGPDVTRLLRSINWSSGIGE